MADNKDTVMRYYSEVWEKADPGAIDQFLTEDYVDHNTPPGMAGDKASAGQIVAAITGDMSDIKMDIRKVIGEDDYVAAHWLFEWTQKGNFMGMVPADGKRLSMTGQDFYRMAGGKIAEIWHVEDIASVMGQLGMVPEPPAG
jgi:steroid delta-isomerase-like uncharacterized protein